MRQATALGEREMAETPAMVAAARETLARLGARPLLDRLNEGLAIPDRGPTTAIADRGDMSQTAGTASTAGE